MQEKLAAYFALLLYSAGAVGLIWLAVHFLLPWMAPFIAAWFIAALLERPVKALMKTGMPRAAASGICTLAALSLLLWALTALIGRGLATVSELAGSIPELVEAASRHLQALEKTAQAHIRAAPAETALVLERSVQAISDTLSVVPSLLSREAMALLSRTAQASPDTLLFAVTAGIGSFFISSAFPKVNAFMLAQLPEGLRRRLEGMGADLKGSFGGFIRAQLILMAMTFFELLCAFLFLKIKNAVILAAITAFVDALPVFGTGIVLIPWAAGCLLTDNTRRGIGLLICWALVVLIRNCVQAKLLGDQIGLHPLASLISIYVGWRVCGVWGMLIFPILLVTLQQLNDRGVVKLWKSV